MQLQTISPFPTRENRGRDNLTVSRANWAVWSTMLAINAEDDHRKIYSTRPSSLSPHPYTRGGFLRRNTPPPPPPRKFDDHVVDSRSSDQRSTGARLLPQRISSDNTFHDSVGIDVNMTPGESHSNGTRGSRGSPSRQSRRYSQADSRSASSHQRPWYPAGSPASSRSSSPHKRPWYHPAVRNPSSGESGIRDRGGHKDTHSVHPTFRHHHLLNEGANGSDAGGTRGRDDGGVRVGVDGRGRRQDGAAVPGAGMDGLSCLLPQTAAKVLEFSESDRKAQSAFGERRRETTVDAYLLNRQQQRQNTGKPARSGRTQQNSQIPLRKDSSERPHTQPANGPYSVCRESESIAMVRGRVRDLQSREKPRSQKSGLSADDNGHTRGDPMSIYSGLFAGHSEQVLALAQHQDVMFSAAADGTAKAWDIYSHQCLATYEGHRKAVWGMQVSSRTLITGSADGTVRFWDIETAQPLHLVDLHSAVRDVVVVGSFLAVATVNPSIEIIDLGCMKPHGKLEGHIMAVSALASLEPAGDSRLVSGSHDTFIRIWDPDTGSCEAVLGGHGGTIGGLCATSRRLPAAATVSGARRGGERAASGESLIVSGSGDSTVRVWGQVGGGTDSGEWACRAVLKGHRHGVWAVHGLPLSGGVFATGGGDATVKIWAPNTYTNFGKVGGMKIMDRGGETASAEHQHQHQHHQGQRWECVGGVRGAAGAVGTVLLSDEALVFGTSEALIATFPLQFCMPKCRPV